MLLPNLRGPCVEQQRCLSNKGVSLRRGNLSCKGFRQHTRVSAGEPIQHDIEYLQAQNQTYPVLLDLLAFEI